MPVKQYGNDSENRPSRWTQTIDFNVDDSASWGGTIGWANMQNGTSQAMPKAVNKKPIFR